MNKAILSVCFLATLGATAAAQTFDLTGDRLYEPLLGSRSNHHARVTALGGAATAVALDGSALWYNPAALALIHQTTMVGSLDYTRTKGESLTLSLRPTAPPPTVTPTHETLSRVRLGAAYVAIPIDQFRDPWTVGFGVAVAHNLDRALAGRLTFAPGDFVSDLGEQIEDYWFAEDQRGVVRAWQFGVGGQISPSVLVGIAGAYYEGTLEFSNETGFTGEDQGGFDVRWDFATVGEERMDGWGGHAGVLIRPRPEVQFGAVLRSPVVMAIELDSWATEQQDLGPVVDLPMTPTIRELRLPFALSAGAAIRRDHWLFAADAGFTDWSQAEYTDALELSRFNRDLRRSYREEYTVSGGVEWQVPASTTTLRAGARWSGLPYADTLVADNRLTLSAGIGVEIDRVVHLDLAASWDRQRGGNPEFGFDERYARVRGIVTMSYRL